jgi:hypothetical protein
MINRGPTPKYDKEEFARRGREIYEEKVLPTLNDANVGKVVAIDIDSRIFIIGEDTLRAAQVLRARVPDAQIWCARIGHPAVDRIG